VRGSDRVGRAYSSGVAVSFVHPPIVPRNGLTTRLLRLRCAPTQLQLAGIVLLAVGLGAYGILVTFVEPISTRVFYDPAGQYMEASLSVFRGAGYAYIDHPGTPVEVLGTIWLALTFPFVSGAPEGFVAYHLAHPELFMTLAQGFLAITSIAAGVFFILRAVEISHWTRALAAVGLGLAFFGLHPEAFDTLAIWSHTSFCFIGGTLLSLLLLLTARQPRKPRWREVLALGFACGVLTSIQLYFAAWIIGTAVTLSLAARLRGMKRQHALRRGEATVVMAVLGFVVATLPIHDRYLQLAAWVLSLSSHQGVYGSGPAGFSTADRLVSNALDLIRQQPMLLTITAACLIVALVRLIRPGVADDKTAALRAVGIGLFVQLLVLLLLVAKHPGSRYLLPIAATLPVLLATLLETTDPLGVASRRFALTLGLTGLALFASGLWSAFNAHLDLAHTLQRDDIALGDWFDKIASQRGIDRQSLRIAWAYGTTSPCYALWYGEWSADYVFQPDIGRQCAHDGYVDIWQAVVWSGSGSVPVANSSDWDVEVIPQNLLNAYPKSNLGGDIYETGLASIATQNYGTLELIVRR
jgi:hypothetical protein